MANEPATQGSKSPAPADGDNRYQAVQQKLIAAGQAMDDAVAGLHALSTSMGERAGRAQGVAAHIGHAELGTRFIDLVNTVSVSQGGAAVDSAKMRDSAQEFGGKVRDTQRTHSRLYGALDDIRSTRRDPTPRPGFFEE
ncbi:conjugal transfer protein TraB (plasmid) [Actinacidiphila glaucinigra]|uniref:conjugal transfer protein TraB n=1 Tax=Actinacidiphila glaucinigra TaxID=235986 RepID=UPI002DDB36EF|nr:conjugal transfer protein TraB [Actinacidiphila glaucinigra]WSD65848.1 conjugal transfer protein TraB [Actinacidiphila glaucinigra]